VWQDTAVLRVFPAALARTNKQQALNIASFAQRAQRQNKMHLKHLNSVLKSMLKHT
jgi:hypothetical protein